MCGFVREKWREKNINAGSFCFYFSLSTRLYRVCDLGLSVHEESEKKYNIKYPSLADWAAAWRWCNLWQIECVYSIPLRIRWTLLNAERKRVKKVYKINLWLKSENTFCVWIHRARTSANIHTILFVCKEVKGKRKEQKIEKIEQQHQQHHTYAQIIIIGNCFVIKFDTHTRRRVTRTLLDALLKWILFVLVTKYPHHLSKWKKWTLQSTKLAFIWIYFRAVILRKQERCLYWKRPKCFDRPISMMMFWST